jgi:hypothetical protein
MRLIFQAVPDSNILRVFRGFPHSLQANAGTVPLIMPLQLPSISFSVHYPLSSNHSTLYSLRY